MFSKVRAENMPVVAGSFVYKTVNWYCYWLYKAVLLRSEIHWAQVSHKQVTSHGVESPSSQVEFSDMIYSGVSWGKWRKDVMAAKVQAFCSALIRTAVECFDTGLWNLTDFFFIPWIITEHVWKFSCSAWKSIQELPKQLLTRFFEKKNLQWFTKVVTLE